MILTPKARFPLEIALCRLLEDQRELIEQSDMPLRPLDLIPRLLLDNRDEKHKKKDGCDHTPNNPDQMIDLDESAGPFLGMFH